MDEVMDEISLLKKANSSKIAKVLGIYQENDFIYVIFESE